MALFSRSLLGLDDLQDGLEMEWRSHEHLSFDDYISFLSSSLVYIYKYTLHYTNGNILNTNITDTWKINLN